MHLPGLVYELTFNTAGNQFLLRPCRESTELVLGVIGRALHLFPSIVLHTLNPLSTHFTALISAGIPSELSDFVCHIKNNINRELTALHKLDRGLGFWERRRARLILVAPDEASLESRFRYSLAQGTKEDLIEHPFDWPGPTSARATAEGFALTGWWFDRTKESEARARGERFSKHKYATKYRIDFTPLPNWAGKDEETWREHVRAVVEEIAETERVRRGDKKVFGAAAVTAFAPTHRGRGPEKSLAPICGPEKSLAPICHAIGKRLFDAVRSVLVGYWEAFLEASDSARHGDGSIPYPPYAYPAALPMTLAPRALEPIVQFAHLD